MGKLAERTSIDRAFGNGVEIELDDGRVIEVRKWSVRKAAKMGRALSRIVQAFLKILDSVRNDEWQSALKEARARGLEPGDDGFPDRENYEGALTSDFIVAIPELLDVALEELTVVICESAQFSDGTRLEADDVLDSFTFESDFPGIVEAILELNVTGKTVKKWSRLLTGNFIRSQNTR